MIKIGDFNKLTIARKAEFGFFLDAKTGNTKDDIFMHRKFTNYEVLIPGDEVNAFVYRDSKDKLAATLNPPLGKVNEIGYFEVVDATKIGYFINIGLEKDILVPFSAKHYEIKKGGKYLFYLYLDKSDRIAATTKIEDRLTTDSDYKVGDSVTGVVYGFQTNDSAMVCVDNKFDGVILHNEYFTKLNIGDKLNLKVIKVYEDGKLGLTPRQERAQELSELEEKIINHLNNTSRGFMPYNDKSDPSDIASVFNCSKKNFKRTLGILMKKGLITQDEEGTRLV
ncbi:MAG: S1-like domain-containing RNA-binding protein [Paeniclostridium sordellii]|uniref:DNA-binding protein n=1 Tax=Paeniclostridium hominis TaxID=2764329 RepID=A0ABR7K776_9FIRM|nr:MULTISPECIES: S1-like domain-containing RNA-binding protein [Paeniclostridium]MBC6004953.1 DNA-binding protein [Paeniclostridium hominis]MDU2591867.1 S1-like domain-containing RNA-binding protein [Paeniclostridium sordellii]